MITSKDNNLIKLCNSIKTKKHSREMGLCLVESFKIVQELYLKGLITHILVVKEKYEFFKDHNCKVEAVSDNIVNYLSDAVTSDGIFAISKIPSNSADFSRVVILDRIQDPSNIGAIIRSARAFGFNKILAINSVYPYSFKCIRASMGYIFDVDYNEITLDDLIDIRNKNNLSIVCADMNGVDISEFNTTSENIAIIIGNEGRGVDENLSILADSVVKIPMLNDVESLNASVSAGIIMFNLKK